MKVSTRPGEAMVANDLPNALAPAHVMDDYSSNVSKTCVKDAVGSPQINTKLHATFHCVWERLRESRFSRDRRRALNGTGPADGTLEVTRRRLTANQHAAGLALCEGAHGVWLHARKRAFREGQSYQDVLSSRM